MFEETGERRSPKRAEWFVADGNIEEAQWEERGDKHRILKLTEYSSNPLEPIREVWEQIKGYKIEGCDEPFSHSIANQMWRAIQESVRRMEEGE